MPTSVPMDLPATALARVAGTLGQSAHILVSWWKPLLVIPPLLAWAWLASQIFDKQAARFFLGREKWNATHLAAAFLAVAVYFAMPIPGYFGFLAGWAALVAILLIDVVVFIKITNADERVPEDKRIDLLKDLRSSMQARASAKAEARLQSTVALDIHGPAGRIPAPPRETPEYEMRARAEQFFIKASQARGEIVNVAPTRQADTYALQLVVDGLPQQAEPLPAAEAIAMIDFWKAAAGLDTADRRRKLIGEVSVRTEAESTPVRLITSGSQAGMRLQLRIDPQAELRRKLPTLGLLAPQLDTLTALVEDGTGVVLLAAPADAGLSHLMYGMARMHDAYTSNVQTLELDVELPLEGVRQNVWAPGGETDFHIQVRALLRRDPDVLALAHLPDAETIKVIVAGDQDRTRTYVCIPAPDALAAASHWLRLSGDPAKASGVLRGVVSMRKVRKLCENCRVPYQPPAEMLQKLGLPPDRVRQLYKRGGQVLIRNKPETCPVCAGIGFYQQTGLFEVFPFDADARAMLAQGDLKSLRGALRKAGHFSLQDAGIRKAVEGVTGIDEVTRVLRPPAAPAPAAT